MPYEEFMQERLFKPLGMKDTTFWPNDEQVQPAGESLQAERGQGRAGRDDALTQLHYPLQRSHIASRCRPADCFRPPRRVRFAHDCKWRNV